jgi:protein arginine kinase
MCAQCGEREAMVFIRRRGGTGEGCDIVLCESCARDRGIVAEKGSLDLNFDELIGASLDPSPPRAMTARCPKCGLELSELLRENRLGCASCADAFSSELSRLTGKVAPQFQDEKLEFQSPLNIEVPPPVTDPSDLAVRLKAALAEEEYEKAALLRDEIARGSRGNAASSPSDAAFPPDFPIQDDSFAYTIGPDGDVVLWSSARLYRNVEGIPFPGSPRGSPAPSRSILLEQLLAGGAWRSRSMAELGPVLRRSLAERGILSRSYAADDEAVLVSNPREGIFALLDDGDHLYLRSIRPGFDPRSALEVVLAEAERIGRKVPFARRPEIGWLSSRISNCGLGVSLSALVHIPAIALTGIRDRLFRALMAEGAVLHGFYSTGEESSGSLYEIAIEQSACPSLKSMVQSLSSAVSKVVQSERRARAEISEKNRLALVDAEGRAFGMARYCALLGSEEASSVVSTLRLASIRGSLRGVEPRVFANLLFSLGAGSLARAQGLSELPESGTADILRSSAIKAVLGKAEYTGMMEEGA